MSKKTLPKKKKASPPPPVDVTVGLAEAEDCVSSLQTRQNCLRRWAAEHPNHPEAAKAEMEALKLAMTEQKLKVEIQKIYNRSEPPH